MKSPVFGPPYSPLQIAQAATGEDRFGYRREFVTMLREAEKADGLKPLDPNRSGG